MLLQYWNAEVFEYRLSRYKSVRMLNDLSRKVKIHGEVVQVDTGKSILESRSLDKHTASSVHTIHQTGHLHRKSSNHSNHIGRQCYTCKSETIEEQFQIHGKSHFHHKMFSFPSFQSLLSEFLLTHLS